MKLAIALTLALLVAGCGVIMPTPTATPAPTDTPLPTATKVPTFTPRPPATQVVACPPEGMDELPSGETIIPDTDGQVVLRREGLLTSLLLVENGQKTLKKQKIIQPDSVWNLVFLVYDQSSEEIQYGVSLDVVRCGGKWWYDYIVVRKFDLPNNPTPTAQRN